MFEFKVSLNDEQYLVFNQYHLLNTPAGKKSVMAFRCVIPLFCIAACAVFWAVDSDAKVNTIETVIMAILAVAWVFLANRFMFSSIKKRLKKMNASGNTPYSKESTIKFDDEFIYEITPEKETKTQYSEVVRIGVTKNAVYIYTGVVQAYILPSNAFSGKDERQSLISFLESKSGVKADIK